MITDLQKSYPVGPILIMRGPARRSYLADMNGFKTLLAISLVISIQLPAQDFRLFDPTRTEYFRETYRSGPTPGLSHWFDNYTNSPIKATRIDSVTLAGNDTILHPFRSWKDTFNIDYMACGYKEGPGWMGREIREMSSGQTVLHTFAGDSVTVWQTAGFAPQWTFVSFPDGKSVIAQLDNFFTATVAGITDTVKEFRLTALDSSGAIDTLAPLHNRTLWLSKSNGFFKTLSFLDLPEYVELQRIENIPAVSQGDIYTFDPGDEFEYVTSCQSFPPWPAAPPSYRYVRILAAWHAPSLSQDTLFYARMVIDQSFTFNPNPAPHLDTLTVTRYDTVAYPNPMGPLYSAVPEQNTSLALTWIGGFGTYRLNKDSAVFLNRPVYTETHGYYNVLDSCLQLNHFEPVFYSRSVAPGIGEVMYESDQRSIAGPLCRTDLIWYRKGSTTFGNYYNIFIGTDEIESAVLFLAYPNPFSDRVVITADPGQMYFLRCYSADGRLIMENEIIGWDTVVSTADWPSGVYHLRVDGKSKSALKTLVKQ
ncbi:MAG: Secretion system C-terminal sorting domain [Bacteroidota bacterium]